jgi:hypothetical protein
MNANPPPHADSEYPMNVPGRPSAAPSWPDVAMKVAADGPVYALVGLVGVLAIKGHASTSEMIITGALAFVSRSWPKPITLGGP